MKAVIRYLAIVVALLWVAPLHAQQAGVQQQVAATLTAPQRMELPIERIRPALTTYYVNGRAAPYWVGTGRMDQFLARLNGAGYDGLNP